MAIDKQTGLWIPTSSGGGSSGGGSSSGGSSSNSSQDSVLKMILFN